MAAGAGEQEYEEEPTCAEVEGVVEGSGEEESKQEGDSARIKKYSDDGPEPEGPDESLQEGKGEEEECRFCLFMKAGPCGKRFSAWEQCVDEAESSGTNIVEKCAQMTKYLKECMESNPQYYGPVLQAEKAMDEQAALEGAKEGGGAGGSNNLEAMPA